MKEDCIDFNIHSFFKKFKIWGISENKLIFKLNDFFHSFYIKSYLSVKFKRSYLETLKNSNFNETSQILPLKQNKI